MCRSRRIRHEARAGAPRAGKKSGVSRRRSSASTTARCRGAAVPSARRTLCSAPASPWSRASCCGRWRRPRGSAGRCPRRVQDDRRRGLEGWCGRGVPASVDSGVECRDRRVDRDATRLAARATGPRSLGRRAPLPAAWEQPSAVTLTNRRGPRHPAVTPSRLVAAWDWCWWLASANRTLRRSRR